MSRESHTPTAPEPRWRRAFAWLPVLVALPLLLWRASEFMPFIADDSLITARYAERLVEGHGLTWTDGERVEGYSNLLWTLGLAALGALGVDYIDAMRVLGIACTTGVFVALARAYAPRRLAEAIPPTLAAVVFASAAPVAAWAIGGLEQPMVAALLAWALVAVFPILEGAERSSRAALRVGIPLALLCWTRPDGPLYTAAFAGVIVLLGKFRREAWILGLRVTVLPVLAVAMQLGFRLIYYGDWLPNPAYIKVQMTTQRLHEGVDYIVEPMKWMVPTLVLALLSVVASFVGKHQRERMILLLCCYGLWTAYLISVGGDIFAAWRHWIPLWVLLAFMIGIGCDWLIRRARVWLTIAIVLPSLTGIAWQSQHQLEDPWVELAKGHRWLWEAEILARVLGEGFREEQPLLAVTAAGSFPYFSKLPALDMLGLNDRHIARAEPEADGDLAHDHGDGVYVLDRQPDLILFQLGEGPGYPSGRQMVRDPRFTHDYMGVIFRGYAPHERDGKVYVRLDGRVGMQIEDDLVVVPGYLLSGKGVFAQPGLDGGIETVLPGRTASSSRILPLGPGTWEVSVDPPNPHIEVGLRAGNERPTKVLRVTEASEPVRLRVTSGEVGSVVRSFRIVRVPDDTPTTRAAKTTRAARTPRGAKTQPRYVTREWLGNFEDGLGTWRRRGNAFKQNPASGPRPRQQPVTGNIGNFLNSFGPKTGSQTKGSITSEPFVVDAGTVLGFRIGGGRDRRVGVRLLDGDRTLMSWHGEGSDALKEVRFDLAPYVGRTLRVQVFDDWSRRGGYVLADEFVLLRANGE